jgi:5-methylcytosine-specific restriction protein A
MQRQKTLNQRKAKPTYRRIERSKNWREISKQYLREHVLCVECEREGILSPAVETDHIKPLANGGNDDPSNLQALCKRHHSKKTAKEVWGNERQ